MKKRYLFLLILNFLAFVILFHLLQNEKIYHATLGKISMNYERTGDWNNYRVDLVRKPYKNITHENLLRWDADIYYCIRETMYSPAVGCYSNVKGAFFPLFSMVWKGLSISAVGISIVNYLLFFLAVAILIEVLAKDELAQHKLFLFIICFSVPSMVFFYIPYTEATFILAMALTVVGFIRKKYLLYFIGGVMVAATRPASLFISLAIVAIEVLSFLLHLNWKKFIQESLLKISPFVTGFLAIIIMQYFYQNKWTVMIEARKFWAEESLGMRLPEAITDWSIEGFGMSCFSIFFLCIPSIAFLVHFLVNTLFSHDKSRLKEWLQQESNYLSMISMAYFGLFLLYTLLYRGGSLNSFSRYTLGSPFFFLLIIIHFKKIRTIRIPQRILLLALPALMLLCFLWLVSFGGGRFRFEYAGMFIGMLLISYYLFHDCLKKNLAIFSLIGIYGLNLLWTSYLFNSFLSDGWIFT